MAVPGARAVPHEWMGCVLTQGWRKSSFSFHEANCTEAALRGGTVLVLDSKLGESSPVLAFSPRA